MIRVTDERGNRTEYGYDAVGDLTHIIDEAGRRTEYRWEENRRRRVVTDREGHTRVVTLDARGLAVEERDEAGVTRRATYDERRLLTRRTDGRGNATMYGYDKRGYRVTDTDAVGNTTRYAYDEDGHLTGVIDGAGVSTTFAYDEVGRRTGATDGASNRETYAYSALGGLVSVTDRTGRERRYERDALNRVTRAIDPAGGATRYEYDPRGMVSRIERADGVIERADYDELGRLIVQTNGAGDRHEREYDAVGNVTAEVTGIGGRWEYRYDVLSRRDRQIDPEGHVTTYAYDREGRLVEMLDGAGRTQRREYDPVGRLTATTYHDNTVDAYAYDEDGRMTEARNPETTLHFLYDEAGRLAETRDEEHGRTITHTYDGAGRLAQRAWEGRRTRFAYDEVGRLARITEPDGGEIGYAYDAAGRETERRHPGGLMTTRRYDEAGRLDLIRHLRRHTSGFFEVTDGEGYLYNGAGNRTHTVDADGVISSYEYDAAGRLSETGITDEAGKRETDFTHLRSMGAFGPQVEMDDATPALGALGAAWLNPTGEIDTGLRERYRAIVGPTKGSLTTYRRMWREEYAYDGAGNRTGLTNGWGRVESTYDRAGRLIRTGERHYEYDGVGNLTGETCRGVHTTYTYNGSNRMTERRHNTGSLLGVCDEDRPNTVRTGYDALGRRVWRMEEPYSGTSRKATYLYDGRGFDLVGETDQDLSSRMVENDLEKDLTGAGGRGRSRMGGGATASGGRRWVAEHLQVGGRPVRSADLVDTPAMIGGVEHKEYYAPDVLGSIRMAMDETGAITRKTRYDVFGQAMAAPEIAGAEELAPPAVVTSLAFGYTGKAQDAATGLMDYGFRDYAPRTARFTTVDPIRDGTNWYAYVRNDPVNKIDRWGLRREPGAGGFRPKSPGERFREWAESNISNQRVRGAAIATVGVGMMVASAYVAAQSGGVATPAVAGGFVTGAQLAGIGIAEAFTGIDFDETQALTPPETGMIDSKGEAQVNCND